MCYRSGHDSRQAREEPPWPACAWCWVQVRARPVRDLFLQFIKYFVCDMTWIKCVVNSSRSFTRPESAHSGHSRILKNSSRIVQTCNRKRPMLSASLVFNLTSWLPPFRHFSCWSPNSRLQTTHRPTDGWRGSYPSTNTCECTHSLTDRLLARITVSLLMTTQLIAECRRVPVFMRHI